MIDLRWVAPSVPNEHLHHARALLRIAFETSSYHPWGLEQPRVPPPHSPAQGLLTPKLTTALPESDPPPSHPHHVIVPADLSPSSLPSHRGRAHEHEPQAANLTALLNAASPQEWWDLVRGWADPKPRESHVTLPQLRQTFQHRMNPPLVLPIHFNLHVRHLHDAMSAAIPEHTLDHTPQQFFTTLFSLDELHAAKRAL